MIKSGVELTNNGSSSGNGAVSIHPVNANWGRLGKAEVYFNVTGAAGTRTIEVSQDGHEFVSANSAIGEMEYYNTEIQVSFYTNSKYLELALSGPESSKFSITRVYYTVPGNNTPVDINDWSGQMEPTGDPGQDDRYLLFVQVSTAYNEGQTEKKCTLTLTGSSGVGNNSYSDSTDIVQHYEQTGDNS